MSIVTIVPILAGTCDLESLVASGHKKIWRPPAANMGFCDFKDVVAFGNNQLWRPLAAKVQDHHSVLSKKMGSLDIVVVDNTVSFFLCKRHLLLGSIQILHNLNY